MLSNKERGFASIHDRHIAVHEYKIIGAFFIQILLHVFFDEIKRLFPIINMIADFHSVFKLDWVLQNDDQSIDVETLIVDNQNLLLFTDSLFIDDFDWIEDIQRDILKSDQRVLILFAFHNLNLFLNTLVLLYLWIKRWYLILIMKPKSENKARSLSRFWGHRNSSLKLFDYVLCDDETKPYPTDVHTLIVVQKAEELKKLILVLFWYSYPGVRDLNFKKFKILAFLNYLHSCFNLSFLREFESIGLKAKQDLHDPMLITADIWVDAILLGVTILRDSLKISFKANILVFGFLHLHAHHFIDCFNDIESSVVLPEFTSFDLGVIEEVLDNELHKLSRILLGLAALIELVQNL